MCKTILEKAFVRFRKWNTLESNFSIPSKVTTVGASVRDEWFTRGKYTSARSGLGRRVNGVATQISSRNHLYNALYGMTDLYHSTCPEFRYKNRKMLGTQPHLTRRSTSTHYVSNPNLIKKSSNMFILYSHTVYHAFNTQHGILSQFHTWHKILPFI